MREVKIKKALNGFIVRVGCKTLVFEKKEKMLGDLGLYIDDPSGTEKAYLKAYPSEDDGDGDEGHDARDAPALITESDDF